MKFKRIILFNIILLTFISLLPARHITAAAPLAAPGGNVSTSDDFIAALGGDEAAYAEDNIIILKSDITLLNPVVITHGEYVMQGSGCYTYRGSDSEALFIIDGGAALTLGNDKGSDDHPSLSIFGNGYKGGAVRVKNGALKIYQGTLFEELEADFGCAVYIDSGNVIMYAGAVKNCHALKGGGAVYMSGGNFTAYLGDFTECTSGGNGGMLYMDGGSFIGGLLNINHNSAEKGGAVYVFDGEYVMNNGSIEYNKAEDGGAICNINGNVYIKGGYLIYNEALNHGGAIYNAGNLYISNVNTTTIMYNTAKNGAAISNNGYFVLTDASISYNTASECAGGIYNTGIADMLGASVSMNESNGRCGGVMNTGKFSMSDGSISSNKSASTAKGMENWGTLILSDHCFISFNNDVIIGNGAKVEVTSMLTANTPVATFTPVKSKNGYEDPAPVADYEIGRQIITGEPDILAMAAEKLAVTNTDNGTWRIDENGKLQFEKKSYELPIRFIIIFGALGCIVIAIAVSVISIIIRRSKKAK